MFFPRELAEPLRAGARHFGAVVLTGPRRSGKTFLMRRTFPEASYLLLEDPDTLARVRSDPRGWLDEIRGPAILDEIQNAPELFAYIRTRIDERPARRGQWLLTGSQELALMAGVTESMTGRAAVFQLLPLSLREVGRYDLVRGGFPEVVKGPRGAEVWFRSYVQTYLERDVRSVKTVKDLATFRRFLTLVAARHGQVLNRTELAAPLGVSVPTVSQWLGILETTGHVVVVPPYYESFGKRLIKSPKLYWVDPGLVCFLLGIHGQKQLEQSPFIGPVFEGFVATEIIKNQVHRGHARDLYYFRDERGLEVDFVTGAPGEPLRLIEAKWSRTVTPAMARPLLRLREAAGTRVTEATIVHRESPSARGPRTVAPGVRAIPVGEFLAAFPDTQSPGARRRPTRS